MSYSKGSGAPWGTTTDFSKVGEGAEDGLVAERDVDDTVVDEGRHGVHDGRLLSSTRGCGRDKDTSVLAPVGTGLPLAALKSSQHSSSPKRNR